MVAPGEIDTWQEREIQAVIDSCGLLGGFCVDGSRALGNLRAFEEWGGSAADTAEEAAGILSDNYGETGRVSSEISRGLEPFPAKVEDIKRRLDDLRDEADNWGMSIDNLTGEVTGLVQRGESILGLAHQLMELIPGLFPVSFAGYGLTETYEAVRANIQNRVNALLSDAYNVDDDMAIVILKALGRLTPAQSKDPEISAREVLEREQNQRDAFRAQFGHDPRTPADWVVADALDPHTYSDKTEGAEANVQVIPITPQPGRGVVRTNLYIPSSEVQNLSVDPARQLSGQGFPMNAGDNRRADRGADAEDSRVSVYVDYENGVVIARQNPTVTADHSDRPRAGEPQVEVNETSDGTVEIEYHATDTFQPALATGLGVDVEGCITLQPQGEDGISYDANITEYPSAEAYQYGIDGQVRTLATHDATMDPTGPMLGLPRGRNTNIHN